MKEIAFINKNKMRWNAFEAQLGRNRNPDPDELADHFIQLTDDLSYARTFYPQSPIVDYLNGLSVKAHTIIYRNKKEKGARLLDFWISELPLSIYNARLDFAWSLLIFVCAMLLGALSAYADDNVVRLVLGDQYVNMTLDNIQRGDPMGVYAQMMPAEMFFKITINNLYVSFVVFLFGIFTPLGSAFIIFRNGIMVGAFLSFFFQRSLGGVSSMAIMIHGSLELSAIVLAGGAGILLGRSILFPGTLPRRESFVRGVRKGTKIMLGLVPFFIVAGVLESFITRYYMTISFITNVIIIISSFVFVIWYFIIYPKQVFLNTQKNINDEKE